MSIPSKARDDYQEGLQRLKDGKPSASIGFFQKAIKEYADYYEAYYHLGVAQARLGLNERAMASFQASINISGGSYALPDFAYALLLCQKGQSAEAERIVRYGLELDQSRSFGKIVLGTVLISTNRFDEAAKIARDVLSQDSKAADAYLILASVDDDKADYAQEVRDLDAFLRIDPKSPRHQQIRDIRKVAARLAEHAAEKTESPTK